MCISFIVTLHEIKDQQLVIMHEKQGNYTQELAALIDRLYHSHVFLKFFDMTHQV